MTRDPDDARRLRLLLGESLVAAGRGADAAAHYLTAAIGADPATRLECQRAAAEQLLISGHIEGGIAALDGLLAEIGVDVAPTPRRALVSMLAGRARLRLRGLGFRDRHRREIADAIVVRLDVLRVAAQGLAMVDSIRGADFQTRCLLLALRTGHRPHIGHALLLEAMFQATQGHLARSKALVARAIDVAGPEGATDPYFVGCVAGAEGLQAYYGDAADVAAARLAEAAQLLGRVRGVPWEHKSARIFCLLALRFVGDYVEVRRLYESNLVDAALRGDRYIDSTIRRACVPMWLADDDPDEARRDLDRATWVPQSTGFHLQHFYELLARAEIALYTGEPPTADLEAMFGRLDGSLLKRVASVRTLTAYLRGRMALASGDLAAADRAARRLRGDRHCVPRTWHLLLTACVA
ncbi:MAG: hypothetical protein KC464_15675, partial [Myxococcales bacterium]|nr:hypothetical protein [Myxococcales bacterium]